MSDTNFVDGSTVIVAAWLNDANDLVYHGVVPGVGTLGTAAYTAASAYAIVGAATGCGITMTTARLLGRTTASTGAIEQITVGSGLALSAGVLSTTGSGSGTVTSVSVVTANGVSGSVATATTTPAITLTLGAITPTTVNGLTITASAAGVLTITAGKTLTCTNTLTFIGTDGSSLSIGAGGTLGTAAYTAATAYAASGLVTASGSTMSTARLLGRSTAATGAVEEITLGTNLSFTGTTLNAAASGSSGWGTLLSTVTASTSATVDVETTFSSTYEAYWIIGTGILVDTNAVELWMRFKLSGAYIITNTYNGTEYYGNDGSNGVNGISIAAASKLTMFIDISNDVAGATNFKALITNPASTSRRKSAIWEGISTLRPSGNAGVWWGAGTNSGVGALTGVRFLASSGNILSGNFRLYGVPIT